MVLLSVLFGDRSFHGEKGMKYFREEETLKRMVNVLQFTYCKC